MSAILRSAEARRTVAALCAELGLGAHAHETRAALCDRPDSLRERLLVVRYVAEGIRAATHHVAMTSRTTAAGQALADMSARADALGVATAAAIEAVDVVLEERHAARVASVQAPLPHPAVTRPMGRPSHRGHDR